MQHFPARLFLICFVVVGTIVILSRDSRQPLSRFARFQGNTKSKPIDFETCHSILSSILTNVPTTSSDVKSVTSSNIFPATISAKVGYTDQTGSTHLVSAANIKQFDTIVSDWNVHRIHKYYHIGQNIVFLFNDNTVAVADISTCRVKGLYLGSRNREYHPYVSKEDIESLHPDSSPSNTSVPGCSTVQSYEANGVNLTQLSSTSETDCENKCRANAECNCWTFGASQQKCYLKSTCLTFTPRTGYTTGQCSYACTRHSGYGYPPLEGTDILLYITNTDIGICESRCLLNSDCRCYMYVPTSRHCTLMKRCNLIGRLWPLGQPQPHITGTCYRKKGCRKTLAKDAPGHDIAGSPWNQRTVEECELRCKLHASCLCYTYNGFYKQCWLKTRCGTYVTKNSDTTGDCPAAS